MGETEYLASQDGLDGPVSSFQSLAAEADLLAKQGDFLKSVECYSKVMPHTTINLFDRP
jgi:hypothetical protein